MLLLSMISKIFVWKKKLTFSQIKRNKEFLKGFIEMSKFISLLRINILLIEVKQCYFIGFMTYILIDLSQHKMRTNFIGFMTY